MDDLSGTDSTATFPLRSALLENWRAIETLLAATTSDLKHPAGGLSDHSRLALKLWAKLFADEISDVRQVRNRLVHLPSSIETSDLIEANELAERLVKLALHRAPELRDSVKVRTQSESWWESAT
ncbi:MAG: hypothetical protein M3273_03400 [Actinomycetota bacterium]|nr:hypothetical protein [Actinomycetota bacterium]